MYDADFGHMRIKMPTPVHDAPFDDLHHALAKALDDVPYDEDIVCVRIRMNHRLVVGRSTYIPDILVSLTDTQGLSDTSHRYALIGECAFSQDRSDALAKLRRYVQHLPHLVVIVLVVVEEDFHFASPAKDSDAWAFFKQNGDCLEQEDFLALRLDATSRPLRIGAPVIVKGHKWGCIKSVEYTVWVRQPGEDVIDLDATDAAHVAHGVCRLLFLT